MIFDDRYVSIEDGEVGFLCEYFAPKKSFEDIRTRDFILKFKDGDEDAINNAFRQIYPQLGDDFAVAVFPSSSVEKNYKSACHILAEKIVDKAERDGKNIIDATKCLYRYMTVPASHNNPGRRDKSIHLKSICVENANIIKGMDVLVLDDVTTSGSSFKAAYELLKAAGANKVVSFAIGYTVSSVLNEVLRYGFIFDLDMTLFDTECLKEFRDNGDWMAACLEAKKLEPYQGIRELFEDIKALNGKIAIVTSSKRKYAKILSEKLGICSDLLFTYEDYRLREKNDANLFYNKMMFGKAVVNPKLELYLRAKHAMRTFEGTMFVVGDMPSDMYPAKQLGMTTIRALWGNKNEAIECECKCDYEYKSVKDFRGEFKGIIASVDSYRGCLR